MEQKIEMFVNKTAQIIANFTERNENISSEL